MQLSKRSFLVLLAIICFVIQANAQVKVFGKDQLEKIQNGHTHIVVNRLDFPQSDEFISVFKKYWTLTKGVDFIEANNLKDNLVMEDSYFTLETEPFVRTMSNAMGNGIFSTDGGNIYLKLWMPTTKTFINKNLNVKHAKLIANVLLTANLETVTHPFIYNFDGEGHIYNWNPGILKNYLQILERQIKSNNPAHLSNHEHLSDLKTQILYCLEDDLFKVESYEDKKVDIKDVFKDYKYRYEAISDKELGEKILNSKDFFYYLLFDISDGGKTIAVVNSESGEIIYSMLIQGNLTTHITSRDLNDLYNTINKN